jgi:hypothetical protein
MRPWIFVDVGDVINWCDRHGHKPPYCGCTEHRGWVKRRVNVDGIEVLVHADRAAGGKLRRLAEETGGELAWCTSWRDAANRHIGPLIGLPDLPVVNIPPWRAEPDAPSYGVWKAVHLLGWLQLREQQDGWRPFVALEDDEDFARFLAAVPGPQRRKVITVDPATALTDAHLEEAREWLLAL